MGMSLHDATTITINNGIMTSEYDMKFLSLCNGTMTSKNDLKNLLKHRGMSEKSFIKNYGNFSMNKTVIVNSSQHL